RCGAGRITPARAPSLPRQVRLSRPSRSGAPPHRQLLDQASAKPPDTRQGLSPAVASETRLERIEWSSPPMIGPALMNVYKVPRKWLRPMRRAPQEKIGPYGAA